mgnify:CR=1 FL=1
MNQETDTEIPTDPNVEDYMAETGKAAEPVESVLTRMDQQMRMDGMGAGPMPRRD